MTDIDRAMADRIRTAATEAIERHHLPGMSVAVVGADGPPLVETFGIADIESQAPMTPALRHCIASVTKTMLGLSLMANVDDGRLSLDSRVVDLLPDATFQGPAESMTLRHLLTHTSGIGEAPSNDELAETVNPQQRPPAHPAASFDEAYPNGILVEVEPGTKWAYANHAYVLLGEILSRAEDGASLDDVFRRRVWSRVGMDETDCLATKHAALSTPYHRAVNAEDAAALRRAGMEVRDEPTVDGHNIRGAYAPDFGRLNMGAGGVRSTIGDMARYAQALLRGGEGIVRPETFAAMTAPQWCPDDRLVNCGLSFSRALRLGRPSFGHTGSYFGGWNTAVVVFPDDGIAAVWFINAMLDEPSAVFAPILRAVFDAPAPQLRDEPVDPAIVAAAPGVFEMAPGRLTNFRPSRRLGRIQISARDGGLMLHSRHGAFKSGVALHPASSDDPAFLQAAKTGVDPVSFALIRDAAGRVTGLRTDELVEMTRTETVAPWA